MAMASQGGLREGTVDLVAVKLSETMLVLLPLYTAGEFLVEARGPRSLRQQLLLPTDWQQHRVRSHSIYKSDPTALSHVVLSNITHIQPPTVKPSASLSYIESPGIPYIIFDSIETLTYILKTIDHEVHLVHTVKTWVSDHGDVDQLLKSNFSTAPSSSKQKGQTFRYVCAIVRG